MNQYDQGLFITFTVLGLYTMGLLYFMILRVNQNLPQSDRISFQLSWGRWKRLAAEYKGFYPRSILPQLMESSAYAMLIVAVAAFVVRFWEYANGIPKTIILQTVPRPNRPILIYIPTLTLTAPGRSYHEVASPAAAGNYRGIPK